jgi:hypothetical protein
LTSANAIELRKRPAGPAPRERRDPALLADLALEVVAG